MRLAGLKGNTCINTLNLANNNIHADGASAILDGGASFRSHLSLPPSPFTPPLSQGAKTCLAEHKHKQGHLFDSIFLLAALMPGKSKKDVNGGGPVVEELDMRNNFAGAAGAKALGKV